MNEYKCKYCNTVLILEKYQQYGAHIINCNLNPNRKQIQEKAKQNKYKIPKKEIIKHCLKCNKEFILFLSEKEQNNNKLNKKYCSRHCANSHKCSSEHKLKSSQSLLKFNNKDADAVNKAIEMRKEGKTVKFISSYLGVSKNFVVKWTKHLSNSWTNHRDILNKQKHLISSKKESKLEKEFRWTREAEDFYNQYKNEPLFMLGLGLYWGEGFKTGNQFGLSNSDVFLIKVWKKWTEQYLPNYYFRYAIYAHSDVVVSDAFTFWRKELSLSDDEKIYYVICNPKSSKNVTKRRLPYGTLKVQMRIGSTEWQYKILYCLNKLKG